MSGLERRVIAVEGMRCGGCEQALVRALEALPGVAEARADHIAEEAEVRLDPALIDVERLRAAVAAAGFSTPAA